jgi:hypothetical protein
MVARARTKAKAMGTINVNQAVVVAVVVDATATAIVLKMVQNVLIMATNRPHRSLKCKQNPFLNLI